jgi:SAM-dependent methyltransferase
MPADWQLPPGLDRGLWDYLHSPLVAEGYDAGLVGHPLVGLDEAFVARHCSCPGRLLDLGCGTGRSLIACARQGHTVVGVDLSDGMLVIARQRAEAERVSVELVRANLVQLPLADGSFDHAVCLFSTLGMIVGAPARQCVVEEAYRVLRPGGRFIVHAHNYWHNLGDPAGRAWLVRDLFRRLCGRESGDRPMPAHNGVSGLHLHHFHRRELLGLLQAVGFRLLEILPIDVGAEGLRGWRTYGWLAAVERPG